MKANATSGFDCMSKAQKDVFIRGMQFACSSGAIDLYECLDVFIRAKPDQKEAAIAAFNAFNQGCISLWSSESNLEVTTTVEFDRPEDLFIQAMQFGYFKGARHRYEFLELYIRANPLHKEAAIAAFAKFERGCGYCPEATARLEEMTDELFYLFVISYVNRYCAQTQQTASAVK